MKIYCAGPIRGDRSYASYYGEIVRIVEELGHTPLTELALPVKERKIFTDENIYVRDMDWLQQAEAMIAEVSAPSLGVGYEIATALHLLKIPVLCLCHRSAKKLSAMISGNNSQLLTLMSYGSVEELEGEVGRFLQTVTSEST